MKLVMRFLGVLLTLLGVVWALQGANVLPGSFMTGQVLWLIIGVICVIVGVGLWVLSARMGGASAR